MFLDDITMDFRNYIRSHVFICILFLFIFLFSLFCTVSKCSRLVNLGLIKMIVLCILYCQYLHVPSLEDEQKTLYTYIHKNISFIYDSQHDNFSKYWKIYTLSIAPLAYNYCICPSAEHLKKLNEYKQLICTDFSLYSYNLFHNSKINKIALKVFYSVLKTLHRSKASLNFVEVALLMQNKLSTDMSVT